MPRLILPLPGGSDWLVTDMRNWGDRDGRVWRLHAERGKGRQNQRNRERQQRRAQRDQPEAFDAERDVKARGSLHVNRARFQILDVQCADPVVAANAL